MLVTYKNSNEVYPVVAIAMDHTDNITDVYFSGFYSAHSQYREDISLVNIVDNSLPAYWTIGHDKARDTYYLTFPEWTSDLGEPGRPGFYERYLEGEPEEIEIMRKYYNIELYKAQEWVENHPEAKLVIEQEN